MIDIRLQAMQRRAMTISFFDAEVIHRIPIRKAASAPPHTSSVSTLADDKLENASNAFPVPRSMLEMSTDF